MVTLRKALDLLPEYTDVQLVFDNYNIVSRPPGFQAALSEQVLDREITAIDLANQRLRLFVKEAE